MEGVVYGGLEARRVLIAFLCSVLPISPYDKMSIKHAKKLGRWVGF